MILAFKMVIILFKSLSYCIISLDLLREARNFMNLFKYFKKESVEIELEARDPVVSVEIEKTSNRKMTRREEREKILYDRKIARREEKIQIDSDLEEAKKANDEEAERGKIRLRELEQETEKLERELERVKAREFGQSKIKEFGIAGIVTGQTAERRREIELEIERQRLHKEQRMRNKQNDVFKSFDPIEGGETTLYYLRLVFKEKRYYKIGVTLNSVSSRYKTTDFKFIDKILYEKKITHANTIEQQIIKRFKEHAFPLAILSSGQTEMFDVDVLCLDV